ncbi:MAG TPA: lamin tail domain-containing protein, partial [Verrucomicrobiae bacterium]|nr:lamin tail domain-containing protein [Verrucomicrobiae bacterium]
MNASSTSRSALPLVTAALAALGFVSAAQGQLQVAGTLFVDVDATQMPLGPTNAVPNVGTLGGLFQAIGGGANGPVIAEASGGGARGIRFDGDDYMQLVNVLNGARIAPPAGLVGLNPTRSIEVWAFNPTIADEETLLSWGRRGGPDGSNMSFNYGLNALFGAVGHWGGAGPDLGWNNAGGAPAAGQWHHLAYTYDGSTTRVYADGVLANSEVLGPGVINTIANTAITLAAQLDADGTTVTGTLRGSLTLARVRIHDGVLTPEQIAGNFGFEKSIFLTPLVSPPTHRYSFDNGASANANGAVVVDSIGGADGVVRGTGATFNGTRLALPGGSSTNAAYVDLPNGLLSSQSVDTGGSGEITFEGWVRVTGSRDSSHLFDFGSTAGGELTGPGGGGDGLDYIYLSAQVGTSTANRRVQVRNTDGAAGDPPNGVTFTAPPFNQDGHFAVTWRESTGEIRIYQNGVFVISVTTDERMSSINDVNNWLGRSNTATDQNAQAAFDEFRIYDRVLSAGEVLANFQTGPNDLNFVGPVLIAAQPRSQMVIEGAPATFNVVALGTQPISYQWRRGGANIPGATGASTGIAAVALTDDGAQFSVVVSNVVNGTLHALTSATATLSVAPDVTGPAIRSVGATSQGLLTVLDAVQVEYDETVRADTATNIINYGLTGPAGTVGITGATLDASGRIVVLHTALLTPGATYTVTVSGVRDRAVAANLIAPNTQTNFVAATFTLESVGNLPATNSVVSVPGGFNISASGSDIGGTSDGFGFHAQLRSGDFDVQVRVDSLELMDGYSEAGLMARDGLVTNAPFAAVLAGASLGGVKFQSRGAAGDSAADAGSMPVNPPYTWLRLQRVGNLFTGFGSLDGQTWLRLGSATISMASQIYVGFAVSSHQPAVTAAARFRSPINATGGTVVNSLVLPFEPLGPSSRRSGLAISEIMYHPPEVPGFSLEYVEIFNGQDYFEDLSGFRLDGDIHYEFPSGTVLQSGGFLVIARDPAAVQSYYGISGVLGPWRMATNIIGGVTNVTTENLPNNRGTVRLENELGGHLLEVNYDSEGDWPAGADGAGHSLVLARPSYGEGSVKAWATSEFVGGSPGRRESYIPDPQRAVLINEFLAHTDPPQSDAIELFNTGTQAVDLSGCWLSDDFGTNKYRIVNGTVLGPRSFIVFTETQLGFSLSSDGEEILLVNSNRTRVLDAVRFGGQANGVSRGRSPNGSPYFSELATPTLGTNNALGLRRDVVINEIMYNPITGDGDNEYVELFNRGTSPVNVGGWRLDDGINFTIPNNQIINAGGYLIVAKNRTNLLARYPNLAANPNLVIGDYGGQLDNGGERIALAMPDYNFSTNGGFITTNVFYIVVNEVTYSDGGRWGTWSDGGGSSLELIDPRADNRLAASWADSDETQKAPWTLIERTAVADLGMGGANGSADRFEMFIEGPGEALVDDVEVSNNGGPNVLTNPGFESGATGWAFQGTHVRTFVQTGDAFSGSRCLHLRAVERGDTGPNRVRTGIPGLATGGTNTATLRAIVRWLRGDPNILLRLRGQWLECAGTMTVPTNLGTPGQPNSRLLANAGPVIYDVTHTPILPPANEPVVVTARVDDPDGVATFSLRYRLDPEATVLEAAMRDDGTSGDAVAGDGIFSATIPGQSSGRLVAFHLRAGDGQVAQTFPNDAPARECHVRFGESLRPGTIATYRMWLTQTNLEYWAARERNANNGIDCTFIYGNWRVVYNAETLYSGSPWHTLNGPYTGPLGNTCDYEVGFPADDLLLGAADFVLNGQNPVYGSTFNQDVSAQAEATAYWFGRKLGLPFMQKRHVFVVLNGQFRGMIYFDHQQPNQDVVDEYFPNDADGRLHKIEDWFEFDDAGNNFSIITCTLQNFVVAGQKRAERYRWTWRPRARTAPNDFADLFALVDAATAPSPEPLTSATRNLVDLQPWMRHLALQHMIGNWDTYGYERGKNCYAYKPRNGGWMLLLWDLDLVLGKDSRDPNDGLFDNGAEPVMTLWYSHPPFVREFWCAMSELANTWMVPTAYSPLVDARFAALRANGVPVDSPDAGNSVGASGGMRGWIAARRAYILTQIPNAAFNVTAPAANSSSNYITLTGTAPVTAKEILVNGAAYPITWTSATAWTLRVPLNAGANTLVIAAVDRFGGTLGSRTNTVTYTGEMPDAEGNVVVNEIMFNPPVDQSSFVELFNKHTAFAFDLSGWQVNGLDYTFPAGAVLAPRSFAVLGRNRAEYAKVFGGTAPFSAQFNGALQNNGETLTLLRPGAQPGEQIVVDKVKYEGRDPWPAAARGAGSSVQLIDAGQDNARVSNWSDGTGWRVFSVTGVPGGTRLLFFLETAGSVYIDELSLVPGTVAGVGTNLIVNGGFESPLAPTWRIQGTNATNTAISTGAKAFGNASLDLRFFPAGNASQYVYQDIGNIVTTNVHTLSFWYLPSTNATTLRFRMSSPFQPIVNVRAPSGPVVVNATPGAPNAVVVPLPAFPLVWLNEVLPVNTTGLADGQGEREPWIELHNSSAQPIPLDGLYLSDDYSTLAKWAFPPGATLQPREFKVIFADGEPNESTALE